MIEFFVVGMPKPGGSKKAFFNPRTGRAIVVDDCKGNKDWRASVAQVAAEHCKEPLLGPLEVEFVFVLPRPQGHYGTGLNARMVKKSAPAYPATRPDVLKLSRSTEDSLTGICWRDDAQIVHETLRKEYGCIPGAWIRIRECSPVVHSARQPIPEQPELFEEAS